MNMLITAWQGCFVTTDPTMWGPRADRSPKLWNLWHSFFSLKNFAEQCFVWVCTTVS